MVSGLDLTEPFAYGRVGTHPHINLAIALSDKHQNPSTPTKKAYNVSLAHDLPSRDVLSRLLSVAHLVRTTHNDTATLSSRLTLSTLP